MFNEILKLQKTTENTRTAKNHNKNCSKTYKTYSQAAELKKIPAKNAEN